MDNKDSKDKELSITSRNEDYSQWYLDVIKAADLAEYGPVRGTMIIKPNGYDLWEQVQTMLDKKFKENGIKNAYFPMLIPERLINKEAAHIEGFSPELAVVTYAGGEKLKEALVVRPTSETIIYDTFSRWIHSHRDLPLLINQWSNVVRWELRPRLFLRTTEFLWQEGHTAHATATEADNFAKKMISIYEWFAREIMAIPVIAGIKSESEKFAGAYKTYTIEVMTQDKKALQFATSHNLGQNFAKVFDLKFVNEKEKSDYVWQTSWGLSTRTIGGLIMVHSDDIGLVLPPQIAPNKVVLVPIWKDLNTQEKTIKKAKEISSILSTNNISNICDDRDIRPGEKYYEWEKKGIPIRIEIGPKDLENNSVILVRRDTGKKIRVLELTILEETKTQLKKMQTEMLEKATTFRDQNILKVDTWEDFIKNIEEGKFVMAHWDEDPETEKNIKEKTKATIRCVPFTSKHEEGKCIFSGKKSNRRVLFARSY